MNEMNEVNEMNESDESDENDESDVNKRWNVDVMREENFRGADSISRVACSDRGKRGTSYLIRLADFNVIEEWCHLNRRVMLS
jgi:hypothetical protein